LSLGLEVTNNGRAASYFIIAQENGITALRSISLAKVGFKRSGTIVTLGRKSNSAEFIEKHQPKRGPFLPESRDIIETIV
jgi:hypothetical protein